MDEIRRTSFLRIGEGSMGRRNLVEAPGIDGVTFDAIEVRGMEEFLDELRTELITGHYRPKRNRKVGIPGVD